MTSDHLTPAQKAVSGFWPGYFDDIGWGFGMSVRTRRTHLGPSVGSYGWPGFYGTAWYNDPAEDMTTILIMQRAHAGDQRLPIVARLLDRCLPGDRRLTAAEIIADLAAALGLDGAWLADIAVLPLIAQRPVRATATGDQRFGKPQPTWGLRGAGDGNRTRTISLGIGQIVADEAADQPDWATGVAVIDRSSPG